MKIIVDSPWYVIPSCLAAGFVLALLLYRGKKNDAPRWTFITLFTLRSLSFSLACLLLAGILLRTIRNESQKPLVILAIDDSRSMVSGADSAFVRTRLAGEIDALRRKTAEDHDVATLYFSSDAGESEPKAMFGGKETDIDNLLKVVRNNYANQNVGALVIFSDGIYNKGSNPSFGASSAGFPIHAVGVGDTSEKTDIYIRRIEHNQIAYLGNNFPVQVHLGAKKSAGRKVRVELLQNGSVKGSREVVISGSNFTEAVSFTLNAASTGLQKYTARVSDASRESNELNNRQSFVVEVLDNREKVLLLAQAPHPDIGAIRAAVTGHTSYDLKLKWMDEDLPPLQQFNLVILHGFIPSSARITELCRQNRIPFWIVNPRSTEGLPGAKIISAPGRYNEAEPYIDESFGYFSISDELQDFLPDFPAVTTFFGNYQVPPGSAPLIMQRLGTVESGQPLLYFNSTEDPRFGVFLGDGLWKWKLRDFSSHNNFRLFAELISKSIQYLAARQDKSFFRVTGPHIISENESAEMSAELYNKSYEPVNAADVTISFVNEQGKKFNYTFSRTGKGYHLTVGSLPPGEYSYRAAVNYAGETFVREGRLAVKETVAEQLNAVADHDLLREISSKSGGRFYTPDKLDSLTAYLTETGGLKTIIYSQALTSPLIDEKWVFVLLLTLLAAEWFIRKRYLTI